MLLNRELREEYLEQGIAEKATHVLAVCDNFSHEYYPVFVKHGEDLENVKQRFTSDNMQQVEETIIVPQPKQKKRKSRSPAIKAGELNVYYGKEDRHSGLDICFNWGPGTSRSDARYLNNSVFTKEVTDELIRRGYDITTLRFNIKRKS